MRINQDSKLFQMIMVILIIGTPVTIVVLGEVQKAQATGCPVDTIIPMVDDAIKSLEAGDTQKALSQMQDMKNELEDTFEVDH